MNPRPSRLLQLAALALLAGCSLYVPSPTSKATRGVLPADQIADVPRSDYSRDTFNFETVLPVELDLKVVAYDAAFSARSAAAIGPPESTVVAELRDPENRLVYAGRVQDDGVLRAVVPLAAAPQDMTLTLQGAGYESREIVIRNMVQYAAIRRTLAILSEGGAARLANALEAGLTADRDGDLVPDVYDAFPDDPSSAFVYQSPPEGKFTVAYEDLFKQAQAGDADYNDFIAKYVVTETADGSNRVTQVKVEVTADTKLAGYNHRFGIRIDFFQGEATLSGTCVDALGWSRSFGPKTVEGSVNVELFKNTARAVGKTAYFTLDFEEPQSIDPDAAAVDRPPYNPYLLVIDTGAEIHLMGEQDNQGSTSESYQDEVEGYPWGLLVPTDWVHPDERQRIKVHYPRFDLWRKSFGKEHADWYLHYDDPYVPAAHVYAAGYVGDFAVFWKDDAPTQLAPGVVSRAQSVFLYGGDVYVAGYYRNSAGNDAAACWKNGELIILYSDTSGKTQARASSVWADSSGVYAGGYVTDASGVRQACYWKNSERVDLSQATMSEVLAIAVSNGSVYAAGYRWGGKYPVACYWIAGPSNRVDLYGEGLSAAHAIFLSGPDVYVAGYYVSAGTPTACYWRTAATSRVDLGSPAAATAVAVSGADVHAAGYVQVSGGAKACYWKNGERMLLEAAASPSYARGLAVFGTDVYVGGEPACYWKNGLRTDLSTDSQSAVLSIRIGD